MSCNACKPIIGAHNLKEYDDIPVGGKDFSKIDDDERIEFESFDMIYNFDFGKYEFIVMIDIKDNDYGIGRGMEIDSCPFCGRNLWSID